MKRRLNFHIWLGFLTTLAAFLSYFLFFARFPVTRDFPWLNLLLFALAGYFFVPGLRRASRQPEVYRGNIFGPVLSGLSLIVFGLFLAVTFHFTKQLPASAGAPRVGQKAPEFTLPDQNGKPVALGELLTAPTGGSAGKANGTILIFYRGYW